MVLLGIIAIAGLGTFVFLSLLGTVMGQAVGVISFLLYLAGAGVLFAVGYFTARLVFDLSEQRGMVIGAALPVTYGAGRLVWFKLGLPTPFSDYDRWRSQDHRTTGADGPPKRDATVPPTEHQRRHNLEGPLSAATGPFGCRSAD
ncbi:hypothetical protein [Streptomyces phaeoluteigriseus]|uniref:hypothetical protein n=1 Tax=Streptomyces phaeoluteigriseus TaxID=114686 RepID=UPI0036B1DE49